MDSLMVNMDFLADLEQFEVFSNLSAKKMKEYLPSFYFRSYKKNQVLYMQGDPRDKIFFLLDGYVMFERSSEEGNMLYLDFIKKNQMFPYGGIFKDEVYKDSAIALTDVYLYFIQASVLEELLKSQPKALLHIIAKLSDILTLHQRRVQQILLPHSTDRVLQSLHFLMDDLGEKHGGEIVIPCPLTAACISKISGTTRETVSLLMNELKRAGIISVESKIITVHQPDYFRNIK
ncbi:Crp/Fnr family transcriptional regulator [Bacillus sp. REN3]|uniref:Crp/Fnr family transcriptional regulator n=1 Tax=Bacillus sp. REN3 TaxID=2802440 RepID=UPI001AEDF521|nr:Crp/Fnr family transcriptional regulator [Bacillus sp. REN3]